MVPLNRLPKGNVLDEWYPLLPSSHAKVEIGSVRVKSKFTVRYTLGTRGFFARAAAISGVSRHIFGRDLEKSLAPRVVVVVLFMYHAIGKQVTSFKIVKICLVRTLGRISPFTSIY